MKFQVKAFEENGIAGLRLSELYSGTSADVLPAHGMLLHAFRIPDNGSMFNIIDNYASADELEEYINLSYKSCKLSPFVCRIPGGKYSVNGKKYEVQKKFYDGSAIHGLLANRKFEVVDSIITEDSAKVTGSYEYINEDPGYPFHYRCDVTYILKEPQHLLISTAVTNLGDTTIPMADGWHPYFQLGSKVDDCVLQFNSSTMLEFDDRLVPTGNKIPFTNFMHPTALGPLRLDNCFELHDNHDSACCTLKDPSGRTLSIYSDSKYPFLQIYIPDHRNSIALENLSGAPDCFNNKMGLLMLKPGDVEEFAVRYVVTANGA